MGERGSALEERKRTVLAAVIICVVLAAVLYSFFRNVLPSTPELVLADPDAAASAEPNDWTGDGVAVKVTPQTVQRLVASLERYESYSRTVTVEYFDRGRSLGAISAQVWADAGWVRTDLTLGSGVMEHSVVGDGRLWLWYGGEDRVYSGPAEDMTADLMQRLPTYETVLALDKDSITAAEYESWGGQPCVYVEARTPALGYLERYWISENSGLLMAAEMEKDGELIYAMSSQEVVSPLDHTGQIFVLPDGTVLH